MAPPGDAGTTVDGHAMDLNASEVDLNIEMHMPSRSSSVSLFNRTFENFDHVYTGINSSIQAPEDETPSIFDKFHEAFAIDRNGDADSTSYTPNGIPSDKVSIHGQLPNAPAIDPHLSPYSYMVEHSGQVPQLLLDLERNQAAEAWAAKLRNPQFVVPFPIAHYHAYNIDGEKALEVLIKRRVANPIIYLIVVRGFKLLMAIRNMTIKNKAIIDGRMLGLFIGRLFHGDRAMLNVFNKYFLPKNLEIVPAQTHGEIRKHFEDLSARFETDKYSRPLEMFQLLRMLKYFADESLRNGQEYPENVGRLMMAKPYKGLDGKIVEVPPGGKKVPSGSELPRCLGLSPYFMGYTSPKWPFRMNPALTDVCHLLETNPLRSSKETATICPRQCYKAPPPYE